MYIFGFDIPLVEVFIGISILIIAIFILLFYMLIKLAILNKKINKITSEEEEELREFKKLHTHEKGETQTLAKLKKDIDRLMEEEKKHKK
ncbi:MAG: hypothetical protein QW666_03190 [Candidatus Woesearchaeota archaeon]